MEHLIDANFVYLLIGLALLIAVVLPAALRTVALSPPVVLLALGALMGLLPLPDAAQLKPIEDRAVLEHLTELTVIISLMGVGLALDRPLNIRSWASWQRWGATWRLLAIGMPLAIATTAWLGWWVLGLAPASAILLGAALAPTDPVLASDVQVEGPTTDEADEEKIDERDEVRFALTSEAGLNDGMAFPFVHLAILVAGATTLGDWGPTWFAWDLVGMVVVGVVIGMLTGWALARAAFRSRRPSIRTAETGEPLLALAAVLLSYGLAQVAHGYGFLAVFACAMTLRSMERSADYHALMHQVVERLERLLTLIVLLVLGVAMTNGLLGSLSWRGAALGIGLVLVVRPVTAWLALRIGAGVRTREGEKGLGRRERLATAFFGIRGIGSIYYLAYATGAEEFSDVDTLWSTVAFVIAVSVVLHGVTATPVMRWLDDRRATVEN
ncbi:cation:proton antiporter [Aeromicrobium wangtongii]|uniref:Cation:proton antiporter n=1 Tax=Aeromicrobium wangtongii TaxID=2969247 RepID=A0ABY5M7A2_9ACTN|nr:cation:proton antiporter [Aeromicrobium wangtongii]MCD9199694.1 cation:proton antiporter [Aeromicrobium wangtongii]UUP14044.1 cation:proton antiporter [Aeromicrobium wangtongii]